MSDKRPPRGIGFLRTIGFAALVIAGIQLASGLAIAAHYVPSTGLAYDSIRALEQDVPWGGFVRSLHHHGASVFVVLAALHLGRVFCSGAYKAPREFTWLTGLALLGVVLAFGFTGYLLPWDQKAYFATKVGAEIAGKTPVLGGVVQEVLQGGESVGTATLTRFYVIHVVVLPIALLALLACHLGLIQRHGITPPGLPVDDDGEPGEPYFPHHTARETLVGAILATSLFALAAIIPAPLEAIAEPSDVDYRPRPDWYFAGAFELLKVFQGPLETLGSVWIPTALVTALALLPFVDRNPARGWRERKFAMVSAAIVASAALALTARGLLDAPANPETPVYALGSDQTEIRGYFALRRLRCLECHECGGWPGDRVFGEQQFDTASLTEAIVDYEFESFDVVITDPEGELGTEDMPAFDYVDEEDRRALWLFLRSLAHGSDDASPRQAK